jgi:xanthine dehydrogenase large subunit
VRDDAVFVGEERTDLDWEKLVAAAQWARVDLSQHSYYATPDIHHDLKTERGRPFAYYAYGTSLTEVLVDCIRGTYSIESIDIVHDVGRSLSTDIDRGQVEGGVVQGMGWSTIEQLRYAPDGRVLTGVNAYKVPDINFCPPHFQVTLLTDSSNPYAVLNSKAVGEPPFVHGLGAYFALLNALRSVRKDKELPSLPLTPEKVLMYLHRRSGRARRQSSGGLGRALHHPRGLQEAAGRAGAHLEAGAPQGHRRGQRRRRPGRSLRERRVHLRQEEAA